MCGYNRPRPLAFDDSSGVATSRANAPWCAQVLLSGRVSDFSMYRVFSLVLIIVVHVVVISAQQSHRDPDYPAHWWTPIDDPKKPDWEIMPQEAGAGEVILSKRHELGVLSNFAPTPFLFHGQRYESLEGFWQMMKY